MPFPWWGSQDRVGIKGLEFLTPCASTDPTGSLGRALWGYQGKERSPGHVPAARFEVTAQSDPWKSWRASKLQPCCPAQLISTTLHQFLPCICCRITFSCHFSAAGCWDPAALAGFWLCLCQCVVLTWTNGSVGNIRVGSPLLSPDPQHRGYLGWRYGKDRSRQ